MKEVCCNCYAKYYVRRQLDKKTSNHSTFDSYCLDIQQQKDEHREQNS
jgi:hypothetical protein